MQDIKNSINKNAEIIGKDQIDIFFDKTIPSLLTNEDFPVDAMLYTYKTNSKEYFDSSGEIILNKGDMKVKRLFLDEVRIGVLIVEGNLEVEETLLIAEQTLLVVTGNIVTNNLIVEGDLIVNGNVEVHSSMSVYFDRGITKVFGDLNASFFSNQREHVLYVDGDISFKYSFGQYLNINEGANKEVLNYNERPLSDLIKVLHEDIIYDLSLETSELESLCKEGKLWKYLDYEEFREYVKSNKPVLKY